MVTQKKMNEVNKNEHTFQRQAKKLTGTNEILH